MPLIPIAMALAQFAPMIAGWLGGSNAENVAAKVVGVAQAVTSTSTPDAARAAIEADPNLAMQFQTKIVESQVEMAQIAADVTKAELAFETNNVTQGAQTVRAEISSDSWLAKNWRPILMLLFGYIVANNYVIAPYMQAMFHASLSVPIPPDLWELLKIGIGGYVVSRGVEKGLKTWKSS
ncbi:hypothetical protein ISF98_29125 [Burkholderia pseudomallei]|nr:hypothetical protein [Burkholderia pseudomallei]